MIYDDFFINKYVFKFYINFIFIFSNSIFISIFISDLFYLNPKLLRIKEEIKGDGGRPQPVLPLTG